MTCSLLPRESLWRLISKTGKATSLKLCIRNSFMVIMIHAKLCFNWLMLALIFHIRACHPPPPPPRVSLSQVMDRGNAFWLPYCLVVASDWLTIQATAVLLTRNRSLQKPWRSPTFHLLRPCNPIVIRLPISLLCCGNIFQFWFGLLRIAFVTCLSFQQRNTRQERAQKQVSLQCITFYWEIASRAYILLCWHKDCDTDRRKTYKWWDDQGLVQL